MSRSKRKRGSGKNRKNGGKGKQEPKQAPASSSDSEMELQVEESTHESLNSSSEEATGASHCAGKSMEIAIKGAEDYVGESIADSPQDTGKSAAEGTRKSMHGKENEVKFEQETNQEGLESSGGIIAIREAMPETSIHTLSHESAQTTAPDEVVIVRTCSSKEDVGNENTNMKISGKIFGNGNNEEKSSDTSNDGLLVGIAKDPKIQKIDESAVTHPLKDNLDNKTSLADAASPEKISYAAILTRSSSNVNQDEKKFRVEACEAPNTLAVKPVSENVIIYVAGPCKPDKKFGITGSGQNLGNWKEPKGTFEPIIMIESGLWIYKGTVPAPEFSPCPFKFVVVKGDNEIEYEGSSDKDNRLDDLLPDSYHFFFFEKKKSWFKANLYDYDSLWGDRAESRRKSIVAFIDIALGHVKSERVNLDDAIDFVASSCKKIMQIKYNNKKSQCWTDILEKRLNDQPNFQEFLLLCVCANQLGWYPPILVEFAKNKMDSMYEYITKIFIDKKLKQNERRLSESLQALAGQKQMGSSLWWLLFFCGASEKMTSIQDSVVDKTKNILKTMDENPDLIFRDQRIANDVVIYLFRINITNWASLLEKLMVLMPKIQQPKGILYNMFMDAMTRCVNNATFLERRKEILHLDFLKQITALNTIFVDERLSVLLLTLFDCQTTTEILQLGGSVPDYLLQHVRNDFIDSVEKRLQRHNFETVDYLSVAGFIDSHSLILFPSVELSVKNKVLEVSVKYAKVGALKKIANFKLILLSLKEIEGLQFLSTASVTQLQQVLEQKSVPSEFFHNLHKEVGGCHKNRLDNFRKDDMKNLVESIQDHLECVNTIIEKVENCHINLPDANCLVNSPFVNDYLKVVSPSFSCQMLRKDLNEIKTLHLLHGSLLNKFSKHDTIEILQPDEWTEYLHCLSVVANEDGYSISVKEAKQLKPPLPQNMAEWLVKVGNCNLFMNKIWEPVLGSTPNIPLTVEEFGPVVDYLATSWNKLAEDIAVGNLTLGQMDEMDSLQKDLIYLQNVHSKPMKPVMGVSEACQDFRTLHNIRHLITPFVAALPYFEIKNRNAIDALFDFVKEHLLKNWTQTTLRQVRDSGLIEVLNNNLNFGKNPVEAIVPLKLISSLVTETSENEFDSPLIKWFCVKSQEDMQAMGRILQGTLLEAYGMLQTLHSRVASFLKQKFDSYKDLLKAVTASEKKFAATIKNKVQEVDCKWLTNMLPEIEVAMRASVISPYQDAREKLVQIQNVRLSVTDDEAELYVALASQVKLSFEELQHAYQLLEMAADDHTDASKSVDRKHLEFVKDTIPRIFVLWDLYQRLHGVGLATYLRPDINIKLDQLEDYIRIVKNHLKEWYEQEEFLESMPLLSILPRTYLLFIADLVAQECSVAHVWLEHINHVSRILRIFLPMATRRLEESVSSLFDEYADLALDQISIKKMFTIFSNLNEIIKEASCTPFPSAEIPEFLVRFEHTLQSDFLGQSVLIRNVSRELVEGVALASYVALKHSRLDPTRILFATGNTTDEEMSRFMTLWAAGDQHNDFFVLAHIERLSPAVSNVLARGVNRTQPEKRPRLLLLAQHQHQVEVTKAVGARLGLVSDRVLEIHFTAEGLRVIMSQFLPNAANVNFFVSQLPGCGKSQKALKLAATQKSKPLYYRIPIRTNSVEELLTGLQTVTVLNRWPLFLHLDVAHSTSVEFTNTVLSLLIYGAVFESKKPKLLSWSLSRDTTIAIELASPTTEKEFSIAQSLGNLTVCECKAVNFEYKIAFLPNNNGERVRIASSQQYITVANFLDIQRHGLAGIAKWNAYCAQPESLFISSVHKVNAYNLLLQTFQKHENKLSPTFTALNAMASFLSKHITAMMGSVWVNHNSALVLFEGDANSSQHFQLNVFELLLAVASDTVSRCLSITKVAQNHSEIGLEDWAARQRAMLLVGVNEVGQLLGLNVVGQDQKTLKAMFHPSLLPILELQKLQFQELNGFGNLLLSDTGSEVALNAIRSLLLLDGAQSSLERAHTLDQFDRTITAAERLKFLIGENLGYVLTGDNLMKMMYILYRIRSGLPVIVFGEAGVGKSALLRFLLKTLLQHDYEVCNVNCGTSIDDVITMIETALEKAAQDQTQSYFLFWDEMNTADPAVIALLKEVMLDRHYRGSLLPTNIYLLGAANPYRIQQNGNREAAVGLAFKFAKSQNSCQNVADLVYRVNPMPLAFYDHVYDFGRLTDKAECTYITEICNSIVTHRSVKLPEIIVKCHKAAREMSSDPLSAVSLRDATRAANLFEWFRESEPGKKLAVHQTTVAGDLSIYLVYAFRFLDRDTFLGKVFGTLRAKQTMIKVARDIAKNLSNEAKGASIGAGAIALNHALCENLFALYVCVLNGIFLVIVGRPGSSKSLSVEILKMVLNSGNYKLRQELGGVPALTELYFQCSPLSTSSGFRAQFESAQKLSKDPNLMLAMVVLDELGLADLSPEKPVKVLHAELERKAVLTSGDAQQSTYSVVALSNWVIDAAQLNRGILVQREPASNADLLAAAEDLYHSLISVHYKGSVEGYVNDKTVKGLELITDIYQQLDAKGKVGGGHFYSMRDFFFTVKNFVCRLLPKNQCDIVFGKMDAILVRSIIRNFGGHIRAQEFVRYCLTEAFMFDYDMIEKISPLDLIMENITDSSEKMAIHIARHLMLLNKSLIGLQLLDRHVRPKLKADMPWNVLFGSCFPGDLQVLAVTRKLRQVEQSIRTGGVLILVHADQLFESLYMVLNQQYWAQGEVTMTQIALGPTSRAITLPEGPFRIIALQDTDKALDPSMSPAVLSRFEKHELNASHLLTDVGKEILEAIRKDPVWLCAIERSVKCKLLLGYHDDMLPSLALYIQCSLEADQGQINFNAWMHAVNPMAMIELQQRFNNHADLQNFCEDYRMNYIKDDINDALTAMDFKRMVIMTNTPRHTRIPNDSNCKYIQIFDIQTELELISQLEVIASSPVVDDEDFILFLQHDSLTAPLSQFQLAKYEVSTRFCDAKCRIVFIVHVDPRPTNIQWSFSFGDGWEYSFVDDIFPSSQQDRHRLPLSAFVKAAEDTALADYIHQMSIEMFRSTLLEMLGPILQTYLGILVSHLGLFYSGVRYALNLKDNKRLLTLLKECLATQLEHLNLKWNIAKIAGDINFDSFLPLSDALWFVFKHRLAGPLSNLFLVSDVWKVRNDSDMSLWCDFLEDNFENRLLTTNMDAFTAPLTGFWVCSQPFGRLLTEHNKDPNNSFILSEELKWLLAHIVKNQNDEEMVKYFQDWLRLRLPSHLHGCLKQLPVKQMKSIVIDLFTCSEFFKEFNENEANVIAAFELLNIVQTAKEDELLWNSETIRNWKKFVTFAISLVVEELMKLMSTKPVHFVKAVACIEVSEALTHILNEAKDLSDRWLLLKITKRMLIFNDSWKVNTTLVYRPSGDQLIKVITAFVLENVVRPRVSREERGAKIQKLEEEFLLETIGSCNSETELEKLLLKCPKTNTLIHVKSIGGKSVCPRCQSLLIEENGNDWLSDSESDDEEQIEDDVSNETFEHLVRLDTLEISNLLKEHKRFLFFFEQIAKLFVQHFGKQEGQLKKLLDQLVVQKTPLRVSWRFLTVTVRNLLATREGENVLNDLLAATDFRQLSAVHPNMLSLLRALLKCADEDVQNTALQELQQENIALEEATMTGPWDVDRIRRVAIIRNLLNRRITSEAQLALKNWADWYGNGQERKISENLLFFLLRFLSQEGDETMLGELLNCDDIPEEVKLNPLIDNYLQQLSPLALGFKILPADGDASQLDQQLLKKINVPFQRYRILLEMNVNVAPFLLRLAVHVVQVAEAKNISLLAELSGRNRHPATAVNCYLPGVSQHPCQESYTAEPNHWYFCNVNNCGTLNYVGDCGQLTTGTICFGCKRPMAQRNYIAHGQVRPAVAADFQDPKGLAVARIPFKTPTFVSRNLSPIETRFCMLLTMLSIMAGIVTEQINDRIATDILRSLPVTDRRQTDVGCRPLLILLWEHILVNLEVVLQLMNTTNQNLTIPDQFKICHLLLHQLLEYNHVGFTIDAANYAASNDARHQFEMAIRAFLNQRTDVFVQLQRITNQGSAAAKAFKLALKSNETVSFIYERLSFSNRDSVQLCLARNPALSVNYPFIHLLLDDNWSRKLDALENLGDAMRFISLVRSILQRNIRQNDASRMNIRDGLQRIIDRVQDNDLEPIILDRGTPITSSLQVMKLFGGLQELWNRFSQLENREKKTFLNFFECQEVNINIQPSTTINETSPLILILSGNNLPETTFVCQLLHHAVEAAASLALIDFIQPHCRSKLGRVKLSCTSVSSMAQFDNSLYAHVSIHQVDSFIRDHAIDSQTLPIAESFAMATVLGALGSTIAGDLMLENIPEFVFKDDMESEDYIFILERRAAAWQPMKLLPEITNQILTDLEKTRSLLDAKAILISVLDYVMRNTEPLHMMLVRNKTVREVVQELLRDEIITEMHCSDDILSAFDAHCQLQVCHALCLLKSIVQFLRGGNDIFGGRIKEDYRTELNNEQMQETRRMLQGLKERITGTLLEFVNQINTANPIPDFLLPNKSLVQTIRMCTLDDEWKGIPSGLRMEHLGHVLLIAETLN